MTMSNSGWLPTPFDGRDYVFSSSIKAPWPSGKMLPHPFAARSQGEIPCCVSIAIAVAMETLDARDGRATELAPLFHYYLARGGGDYIPLDLRRGMTFAAREGLCSLPLHPHPYDLDGARLGPTAEAQVDAREHRLGSYDPVTRTTYYQRIRGSLVDGIRDAVAGGSPVVIGFWLTSAYDRITPGNPVHPLLPHEPSSDGHAVAVLGYDDGRRVVFVKDSRGPGFGRGGVWMMPYENLDSPLVNEGWVLRQITYNT